MKLAYTVSKLTDWHGKDSVWYAHMVGFPNIPVMSERGTFTTKRKALHTAADSMGLQYAEYMKLRQKSRRE